MKKPQTKLAPRELCNVSKPALADLVWALAREVAMLRDVGVVNYTAIVQTIVGVFDGEELASSAAYANGRGKDGLPSDALVIGKLSACDVNRCTAIVYPCNDPECGPASRCILEKNHKPAETQTGHRTREETYP